MSVDKIFHNEQTNSSSIDKAYDIYNASVNKPANEQREYIQELEKLYRKNSPPLNEVADLYASALFNLSLRVPAQEMKKIYLNLETLFQKNPTETIAEQIGRLKYNLSVCADYNDVALKQCAEEIERLYNSFQTVGLAEPLAKIWYSIAIRNAVDYTVYATKIVNLYSAFSDPQTNTAYAKILFDDKFDLKNRKELIEEFLSKIQDLDSFRAYIESPYYPQYNEALRDFKLCSSYPVENLGMKMNHFLRKLKKRKSFIEIKAEILSLLYYAFKIKRLLIVPRISDPIGHYTKIENLKYLLLPGNLSGKLRMYHAEYMNDPSEGKMLLNLLMNNSSVENSFYIKDNSKIYLSCFTTAIDNLPMWSMYGNDAQGCCLVFKDDYFDYTTEELTDSFLLGNNEDNENNYLYRVCYLSCNGDSFTITIDQFDQDPDDLNCRISDALNQFVFHFNKLFSLKSKSDKVLDEGVALILDQIRYLFKDSVYSHEHELRLIKYSETPLLDSNAWIVPKLYVEVQKPLKYERVILGPKVTQANRIIPYLIYTGKVDEVVKSEVRYR